MAYVSLMRLVDGGNTTSGVQWDESTGSNCTRNQSLLDDPVRCLSSLTQLNVVRRVQLH